MNFGGAVFARPLARIYFSWEIITLAVAVELRGLVFSMINHNINDRSITYFVHTTHSLSGVVSPYYEENKVAKAPLFFFVRTQQEFLVGVWAAFRDCAALALLYTSWTWPRGSDYNNPNSSASYHRRWRPVRPGTYVERKMMFWKKGISWRSKINSENVLSRLCYNDGYKAGHAGMARGRRRGLLCRVLSWGGEAHAAVTMTTINMSADHRKFLE